MTHKFNEQLKSELEKNNPPKILRNNHSKQMQHVQGIPDLMERTQVSTLPIRIEPTTLMSRI
jgi:hypothetical protein